MNRLYPCYRCKGQVLFDIDDFCLQCGRRNVRHDTRQEWDKWDKDQLTRKEYRDEVRAQQGMAALLQLIGGE